jgi:hypothetical protein
MPQRRRIGLLLSAFEVTGIGGFSTQGTYAGRHGQGVTSADAGHGLLFATDRDAKKLSLIDPKSRSIVATSRLASGPDYVRFVAANDEIWVTEPGAQRIESSLFHEKAHRKLRMWISSRCRRP